MKRPVAGTISLIFAAALYGSYGILSRFIGESFGPFAQNWLRSLMVFFIATTLIVFTRLKLRRIHKKDYPWIVLWLFAGSTGWLTFIAFNNLPLGTVYFLTYATMIISSYTSGKLLYGEKLDVVKIISVCLAIVGLYLIYSFSITPEKIPFAFVAFASGAVTGFWNTISKKFSDSYSELQLIFVDSIFSPIFGFIMWYFIRDQIAPVTLIAPWFWLLVFSFVGIGTTGLIIFGFKHLEAQIGSIILPIEIVFAIIFGFVFFGETLSLTALIGGGLIGSAAILPSVVMLTKTKKRK